MLDRALYTVLNALSRPSTPRASPSPPPAPTASTSFSDLPAEMQHLIGQHIFDPDRITPHDRLSGYGPFTGLEGERKAEFESLLAFAGTCRSVRRAVAPIVLRSLTFRRLEDVRAMTERNWLGCVRLVRLDLDALGYDSDTTAEALAALLHSMPRLQHLYISSTARQAPTLAALVERLLDPKAPTSRDGRLSDMLSLGIDAHQEQHNPRPVLEAVAPLLSSLTGLDFLLVRCFNEVERTRSRPRVLPLLAHVVSAPRALHLGGCWQERDDDLLALLPRRFQSLKHLFIFHGCDHNNHGQWRENSISRLEAFPDLQTVIWEIEAFWQAVEAELSPHNPEHYAKQLAASLPHLSVVGFSRYNHLSHVLGIRREVDEADKAVGGRDEDEEQSEETPLQRPKMLQSLESCPPEVLTRFVMSPAVVKCPPLPVC